MTNKHNKVSFVSGNLNGQHINGRNRIGGVMVSVLASHAGDRWFEPRSGQTKDFKIGICCFSAKHAALRSKSKDWSARSQYNVSEWGDRSSCGLLLQCASTIKSGSACRSSTKQDTSHSIIDNLFSP